MTSNVVPIDKEKHKNIKVKPGLDLSQFESMNSATVVFQEFRYAAVELPIVFAKAKDGYVCILLLGNNEQKNYYLKEGKPRANFLPASFSHYPFGIVKNPDNEDQIGVLVDESSHLINESEGEAIFKDDGTESEYFDSRVKAMITYSNSMNTMNAFVEALVKNELLTPHGVKYKIGEEEKELSGYFVVNEKKLNELSDEVFLTFRKKGYLSLIYTHLDSLQNIPKLANYIGE